MVHKNRKITRMLSVILAAVIILTSGGFEVLAADAGEQTEWEAVSEDTEAAGISEEASDEESNSPQGTGETPEADSDSTRVQKRHRMRSQEIRPKQIKILKKIRKVYREQKRLPEKILKALPNREKLLKRLPKSLLMQAMQRAQEEMRIIRTNS